MFLPCQTSCANSACGVYCVVGVGGADRAAGAVGAVGAVGVQETTRPLLIVEQIVQRVRRRPDRRAVAGAAIDRRWLRSCPGVRPLSAVAILRRPAAV